MKKLNTNLMVKDEKETVKSYKKNKKILLFILLSYLITWVLEIPAFIMSFQFDFILPMISNMNEFFQDFQWEVWRVIAIVLFTISVYGPWVAAIIVRKIFPGNTTYSTSTKTKSKSVLLFVLSYFFFVGLLTCFLAWIFTNDKSGLYFPLYPLWVFFPILAYQFFTSGFEELGWRGFLLPALLEKYTPTKSSWVIGIIWSIWHWPFMIYLFLQNDMSFPVIVVSLIGNIFAMIPMAMIYTWIMMRSHKLLYAMIFHALGNTVTLFLATRNENIAFVVGIVMSWIVGQHLMGKMQRKMSLVEK